MNHRHNNSIADRGVICVGRGRFLLVFPRGPSSINVQFANFAVDEEDLSSAALYPMGDVGVGG